MIPGCEGQQGVAGGAGAAGAAGPNRLPYGLGTVPVSTNWTAYGTGAAVTQRGTRGIEVYSGTVAQGGAWRAAAPSTSQAMLVCGSVLYGQVGQPLIGVESATGTRYVILRTGGGALAVYSDEVTPGTFAVKLGTHSMFGPCWVRISIGATLAGTQDHLFEASPDGVDYFAIGAVVNFALGKYLLPSIYQQTRTTYAEEVRT